MFNKQRKNSEWGGKRSADRIEEELWSAVEADSKPAKLLDCLSGECGHPTNLNRIGGDRDRTHRGGGLRLAQTCRGETLSLNY